MATPAAATIVDNTVESVEESFKRVKGNAGKWTELTVTERVQLIENMIGLLDEEAEGWAATAARGMGVDPSDPAQAHLLGEAMMKGPAMTGGYLNVLLQTFTSIRDTGSPPPGLQRRTLPNGSIGVKVFPRGVTESIFCSGMWGELVFDEGGDAQSTVAEWKPTLTSILAAGNFDAPTDLLHNLFVRGHVAVFKTNPVNCCSAPHVRRVLAPLIEAGFCDVVVGGVEIGQLMTRHPLADDLLMTGSARTYDRIVWGSTAEEIAANKKSGTPNVSKPFDAELGSVNPVIICPGEWSESQLRIHAHQIAASKMFNNGHICASPQVIVTAKKWAQREQFLDLVQQALTQASPTSPYYPNCELSYKQQLEHAHNPAVCEKAPVFANQQNPIFQRDIPMDHYSTREEAFCPVLSEMAMDECEATAESFLPLVTDFLNSGSTWGSLTCTVIIDPKTQARCQQLLDSTIGKLKFGAICINGPSIFPVVFGHLTWGAYPRHPTTDIQSGIGQINNAHMWKNVSKSVLHFPFTSPAQMSLDSPSGMLAKARCLTRFHSSQGGVTKGWRLFRLVVNAIAGI